MKTLIIAHKVKQDVWCPDGQWSAYIARLKFPKANVIGCCYQEEPPNVSEYDRVIIVDFSFPAPVLEQWAQEGKQVMVIDHHETALNNLSNLSSRVLQKFDMKECGATLCWKTFFPDKPLPAILEYVRDRDLWNHESPYTEEMHEAIASIGRSFELFDALLPLSQEQLIGAFAKFGERLLKPKRERVSAIAQTATWQSIDGHEVLGVEVALDDSRLISDVCSYLYSQHKDSPFVVAFVQRADGQWDVSFRSDKKGADFPVNTIAAKFGGGGHRNAAGCRVADLNVFDV